MTMVVDSLSQVILQKSKMVSGSGPWVAMYSLFFSKPMDGKKNKNYKKSLSQRPLYISIYFSRQQQTRELKSKRT